jgi:CRISPR-associated protein Csb2
MSNVLSITTRFLHPEPSFHGRNDGGEPEWPPSPLRLFQALVDAAANRWREPQFGGYAKPALEWFQQLAAPEVVAPAHTVGTPFRIAVPNNDLDVWAGPISKGNEPKKQPNELKTMKQVRPTHLSGEAVHYLYALPPEGCPHLEVLKAAARSVTHLGWGIDMVAADAAAISQEDADKLPGHRWQVVANGGVPLRVPKAGTLNNLMEKHEAFLGRLSADGFRPVPPLQCFDVKRYHSPTAGVGKSPERPFAAFQLLAPDASRVRAFNSLRGVRDVAAWVRNATAGVCGNWPFENPLAFVQGHDPTDPNKPLKGELADARFSYLPLPSIERRGDRGEHVGGIRRVVVSAPPGCAGQVDWVRRRLTGQELVRPERPDEPVGLLNLLPTSDWVLQRYVGPAEVWSSVTPVLLPGYDDRDPAKAEGLLVDAFRHVGYSPDAVVREELAWRGGGFRAGVDLAGRYERPDNLKRFPAYHVRVRFRQPVTGPLAVGAGRYRGFGLFVQGG